MPPTIGHGNLIKFADRLGAERVNVLVCTQPDEPFFDERYEAVVQFARYMDRVNVYHLHDTLPQDPDGPGFWEMWDYILKHPQPQWLGYDRKMRGAQPGDYYVTSEPYGNTLATRLDGEFFIYDRDRDLHWTKATEVRTDGMAHFDQILPQFRHNLQITATIFGAESTGKTTLAKLLAQQLNSQYVFEWARPYLETVGPEVTVEKMEAIFTGQSGLQYHASEIAETPFIIQDTDLYSTIGYWHLPQWQNGEVKDLPYGWERQAAAQASDLYIICKSNIPFEEDQLRYGGKVRESPDQYWIDLCETYGLNYVVLNANTKGKRTDVAANALRRLFHEKTYELQQYDRHSF